MLLFAAAPADNAPPLLWVRYTQVMELHLSWEDVGGAPDSDDIATLAGMVNIWRETQAMKARVAQNKGGFGG